MLALGHLHAAGQCRAARPRDRRRQRWREMWLGATAASRWRSCGCDTSAATTTGSTARCSRITPPSSAPSTPWAAGRTATQRDPAAAGGSRVPAQGVDRARGGTPAADGAPRPAIGFLQESLRWWDHWLKGADTGIMDEPMLRAWVMDSVRPAPTHRERPGRWVSAPAWPPPVAEPRTLWLTEDGLAGEPASEAEHRILGRQACGLDGGAWCGEGETADDPDDQRADDGMSLASTRRRSSSDLHPRLPAGDAGAGQRPAAGARLRAAVRGVPGRRLQAGDAHHPQPLPPRLARAPAALEPGRAYTVESSSTRSGTCVGGRQPAAGGACRRPTGRGHGRRRSRSR